MKSSLIIVGFFLLGVLCGRLDAIPSFLMSSSVSFCSLCALLLCVGMGIGSDPMMVNKFRSINPRLVLLPLATILGTIAGTLLASIILTARSTTDCLAVGCGFGYYSLSSIFITEYRGAELGTIALLANIMREMITLLLSPLLVKVFGPLAPISSGGATSMDTTLPIITISSGKQYAIVSVFHGFIVDFSVPFLVTLWCTL